MKHLSAPATWVFFAVIFAALSVFSLIFGFSPLLPVVIVSSMIAFVLLFESPLFLLAVLIVLRMSLDYSSQFYTVSLFDITLSLSQLLGGGIALLGLFLLFLHRNSLLRFPLIFPFILIFLWGGATLAYSIAPLRTLQELLRFFDLFVLSFLAFVAVKKTADLRTLLLAFFVSSILPLILAVYQFVFSLGFQDADVTLPRIFGTFSHPNVFSLYLFSLIVFAVLYSVVYAKTTREKFFVSLYMGILMIMLLLTFARVAWVALFLFAFLLAIFRYRLLLFPLLLIPFVLFVFSPAFQSRIESTLSPDPDSSIVWRQTLWHDVTTKSIQDGRYYLGSGMDTFPVVSESLRGARFGSNDSHNDFVKFFVEGGVVGVSLFALYLLSLLYIIGKRYAQSKPERALRLSYGILLLFFLTLEIAALSDNVFKNTPVQWLFFGLLGALLSLSQEKK
ncbi:MAG: hypothetical protein A2808_03430 [Candidatus Moranbacteria bacterium RIFCSPHIGHO2_01_FULL_55_24]|nr:MAG: hypothetical protein A2808_03430 [Candidatus Moranbacteria bacterium RIFCSPHIGHO2_01_FULL_55_24]